MFCFKKGFLSVDLAVLETCSVKQASFELIEKCFLTMTRKTKLKLDVVLAFGRLRREDCHKFNTSLNYRVKVLLPLPQNMSDGRRRRRRRRRDGGGGGHDCTYIYALTETTVF